MYVPGTLPCTWVKFMNKTDKIPYPQGTYIHGKKKIKTLNTVFLSATEKARLKKNIWGS